MNYVTSLQLCKNPIDRTQFLVKLAVRKHNFYEIHFRLVLLGPIVVTQMRNDFKT